jgi:hypothetical protein
MTRGFLKGPQQCAVEFFKEFWKFLGRMLYIFKTGISYRYQDNTAY